MPEGYLIKGLLIGLVFGVPAGAIGALTVERTLAHGFGANFTTGLGSSAADVLYACVGVFGPTIISDFLLAHHTSATVLWLCICHRHFKPSNNSLLFSGIFLLWHCREAHPRTRRTAYFGYSFGYCKLVGRAIRNIIIGYPSAIKILCEPVEKGGNHARAQ